MLVFSITDPSSLNHIYKMYDDLKKEIDDDCFSCVVATNNCELREKWNDKKVIPISEYKNISKKMKCPVIETSVVNGAGVNEVFYEVVKQYFEDGQKKILNLE